MGHPHSHPCLALAVKALGIWLAVALITQTASLPVEVSLLAPQPGFVSAKELETQTLDLLAMAKSELVRMDNEKGRVPAFLLDKFRQNVQSLQTLVEEIQGGLIENKILQYSTMILTVRDGTQLFTRTFIPTDPSKQYTTVMDRSPYGPSLSNDAFRFVDEGYAVLTQDIRGTGQSTGYFDLWRQDSKDGYDTMSWIIRQPWSSGKVLSMGVSADGCSAVTQWLGSPPWLKSQWVTWYSMNGHPTAYPGGGYRENLMEKWLITICPRCIQDLKANEAFGPYWDPITGDGKFNLVTGSTVSSTGWYDIFTEMTVAGFNGAQYQGDAAVRGNNFLVATPGGHCQDTYHPNKNTNLPDVLSYKMFDYIRNGNLSYTEIAKQIKNEVGVEAITFYVMGPDTVDAVGNYWTSLPFWPEHTKVAFYFESNGLLSESIPSTPSQSMTYRYDPSSPIRTIGGNELFGGCGPSDQSRLETRTDLLLFTTETLTEHIAITGEIHAILYVSSSAIDTDFTVKVTDVHPDGRSLLIADGIIRMRWRQSKTTPVMMTPGEVYEIDVFVGLTSYVFNAGHRIRVAVSSSNYPRFSANPNNGNPLSDTTGPLIVAQNSVFADAVRSSRLVLPVVDLAALPASDAAATYIF